MQMDVARVQQLAEQQRVLMLELEHSLGGDPGPLDEGRLRRMREKLIRNRVLANHVLELIARLQERLVQPTDDEYGADGTASGVDAAGRLLRTSV